MPHFVLFLLEHSLAFRGHDERDESYSRGNFIELLKWLGEKVKEVDESSDMSQKEQLALVLRFVNRDNGKVMERFLGIVHVGDTTALSLKDTIMSLLVEYSLIPSMIRGQGYDETSNMKGEINGLKTLIMNDTPRAYYIHCFAHQLQLTLVVVAKRNDSCGLIFEILANLLNVVGVYCKRREMIRNSQAQELAQAIEVGEILCGSGLNQELGLKRPGDTRWGSHYKCLVNIIRLFYTILKEQDIVNAMELVTFTKSVLQKMREQGWETFLNKVTSFCTNQDSDVLTMDSLYVSQGRSRRTKKDKTYPFVYLLIKLMLILPVATASVERVFSAMTYVKSKLRNSMGDQFMNDCLVTFIEKEMFLQVPDEEIIDRFQNKKTRMMKL
ncbi:uncharacterized protein LOC110734945 [Chenopodium quinoa]|uniref:uncharacterized protein LOC110734945 n=1 Tax=Chenopodium quinoa TaxID=63459 RepID=UPI000B780067|nr:uncharacterized protein LOC110734945 [Chenopodium quinoa]